MRQVIRCITCLGPSVRAVSFVCMIWLLATWALAADVDVKKVTFEGAKSEHKWTLKELNPELPADWSAYKYLVMEFKASSPQRFFLWLYNADGPRRLVIQPFGQNVWMRASMPLSYFKGRDRKVRSGLGQQPAAEFVFHEYLGAFRPLNAIQALGVTMDYPVGKPTLEIRSVRVAKEDPGSDFLEKLPVVDEFGQWIPAEWPGKIKDLEQLKQAVGRGRKEPRRRRVQLLPLRRLHGQKSQGDGLLPGRTDRGKVVVCRS